MFKELKFSFLKKKFNIRYINNLLPSRFTYLLLEAINEYLIRSNLKDKFDVLVDLGAREGTIAICTSHLAKKCIATEIDDKFLELININSKINNIDNVEIVETSNNNWFGKYKSKENFADIVLFNPPTVPEYARSTYPRTERNSYLERVKFGGKDGKYHIYKAIPQIANSLKLNGVLIMVVPDYVASNWLLHYLDSYNIQSEILIKKKVESHKGQLEWEIKDFIVKELKGEIEISDDLKYLSYNQLAIIGIKK